MKVLSRSPQNLKASSTDPYLVYLSKKAALCSSLATAMTSFVAESMAIISIVVAPEPLHDPVAPFFTRLIAAPTGKTMVAVVITPTTGLLALRSVIAKRIRTTSGPGSVTIG